ncbi:hypothetical protein PanNE5_18520 [Pandoraea sp. NE5]|nr:hypothetical protein PanNE5_18520 [Pandoraea sp. NE5]
MIRYANFDSALLAACLSLIFVGGAGAQSVSQGLEYQIRACFSSIDRSASLASQGDSRNVSGRLNSMVPTMRTTCRLNPRLISQREEQIGYCNSVKERVMQVAENVGDPRNYSGRLNAMSPVISAACGG